MCFGRGPIWHREGYYFPNYPPPDHNLGQILNSDLASSYFPFNTPTVFVFLPVLHPNRSFEISMTIVLILQQGLSESSRSRVSLLHSAQCKMAKMVWNEKFGFKGAVKGAANEKFGVQ